MIYTSANSHLGDVAWFCHVLRRILGSHTFYCPTEYHWQVAEMLEGCDVELRDVSQAPPEALNTWIACGRFEPQVRYENNVDMVDYLMRWDNALLRESTPIWEEQDALGLFAKREDLLFDFPAIRRNVVAPEFDVLVVNSPPLSGQCPGWDQGENDQLINDLAKKHRVLTTNTCGYMVNIRTVNASLCNIGNLSLRAKCVVAVASGAHWCVHNRWNQHVPKYIFLAPQVLNYGVEMPHAANVGEMRELLTRDGWL